jgi:hypothetical protein
MRGYGNFRIADNPRTAFVITRAFGGTEGFPKKNHANVPFLVVALPG